MTINIKLLEEFAGISSSKEEDDLTVFEKTALTPAASRVNAALAIIRKEKETELATKAAHEIIKVEELAEKQIANVVTLVRHLRQQIRENMNFLTMLNHAQDVARTTGNYVPEVLVLEAVGDVGQDPERFGLPPFPKAEKKATPPSSKKV